MMGCLLKPELRRNLFHKGCESLQFISFESGFRVYTNTDCFDFWDVGGGGDMAGV